MNGTKQQHQFAIEQRFLFVMLGVMLVILGAAGPYFMRHMEDYPWYIVCITFIAIGLGVMLYHGILCCRACRRKAANDDAAPAAFVSTAELHCCFSFFGIMMFAIGLSMVFYDFPLNIGGLVLIVAGLIVTLNFGFRALCFFHDDDAGAAIDYDDDYDDDYDEEYATFVIQQQQKKLELQEMDQLKTDDSVAKLTATTPAEIV